jgi:hypothetical protein
MKRPLTIGSYAAAIAGATALSACLPSDTRSEPASILVSVEASDATRAGFTTDDGWTITFERFLVGMGSVRMAPEDVPGVTTPECTSYYDAIYDRVFDFARTEGPRKLGLVFALGSCVLHFDIHTPMPEALLGPGVTPDDASLMRLRRTEPQRAGATSIGIVGHARRGELTKSFDWSILANYDYGTCGPAPLELESGDTGAALIVLHGEALFRVGNDESLAFDPFADADRNGDGDITMDELALETISIGEGGGGGTGGGGLVGLPALATQLYYGGVPQLATLEGGGPCHGESD